MQASSELRLSKRDLLLEEIGLLILLHRSRSCPSPALLSAWRRHDAERLASVLIFGSAARGSFGPDSDLDILIVSRDLPDGRMSRVRDFAAVERALAPDLGAARRAGWNVELSPVFKTPAEVERGSALFFDMTEDARILEDRDGLTRRARDRLRDRLAALGARRVWRGNAWYWDLKPDCRPGEIFET
jgi:predicted nucleotidyltransferase